MTFDACMSDSTVSDISRRRALIEVRTSRSAVDRRSDASMQLDPSVFTISLEISSCAVYNVIYEVYSAVLSKGTKPLIAQCAINRFVYFVAVKAEAVTRQMLL